MSYEINQLISAIDHCLALLDPDHGGDMQHAANLYRLQAALRLFDRNCLDISGLTTVQVRIDSNGKTLWINTKRGCIARLSQIGELAIDDYRPRPIL